MRRYRRKYEPETEIAPWIDIIIPVFNAERHIKQTLNSLLNQTYPNFRILLCDDASTDSTPAICIDYANRYKNVLYYRLTKHGGVSKARNEGLANATNEYIAFVDHDDLVDVAFFELLVKAMNRHQADLTIGTFNKKCSIMLDERRDFDFIEGKDLPRKILKHYCATRNQYKWGAAWGKLFKHNVISQCSITFNESMEHFEDTLFVYDYLAHCSKIALEPCAIYRYTSKSLLRLSYKRKSFHDYLAYIVGSYRFFGFVQFLEYLSLKATMAWGNGEK